MELRHLRYLVAAVEEASLQGAAQRMNVAQPALSRRIRDLEATLGCDLFVRGPRGVTPTRAGQAFYRKALALLDDLDQAGHLARRLGREDAHVPRLGLVQTSRKYVFLQEAVGAYRQGHPDAALALTRGLSPDLALGLKERRLDLTLLYEWRLGAPAIHERLIHKERYVLAVHPGHRLATARPVRLAELAGEPLVWLSRQETVNRNEALMQQCRLHGLDPVVAHMAASHDEQLDVLIATGGACLTMASSVLETLPGALVFRPLADFDLELDLSLAWSVDLAGSPAGALLDQLHAAIDRHQDSVRTCEAAGVMLHGHRVIRAPHESDGSGADAET